MTTAIKNITKLGLREYKNPTKLAKLEKDVRTQMLEMEGKIPFGKGQYHNEQYENLIQYLSESRNKYRQSKDLGQRQEIAQGEYAQWKQYIEHRRSEMPDDIKITEKQVYQLKQIWDLVKGRKERNLRNNLILEFHNEYAKKFKFDIKIDPKCLVQMIHPHHGYLNLFPGSFTFDQLIEIFNLKLVATMERTQGQDLLADEISSFVYWSQFDNDSKGYMNNQEFYSFLRVFKFDIQDYTHFNKEFQFALNLHQGEYNKECDINRFDFFRYLFLERNL